MKEVQFEIKKNEPAAAGINLLELRGDTGAITAPGQFVEIALPGKFLRRPISVCDWSENRLTLYYRIVGSGTELMSRLMPGETLQLLTGLGNGFDTSVSGEDPVLVGGGVGATPMFALAKKLLAEGKRPQVVLGFNKEEEIFLKDEFEALGADLKTATADGSCGTRGFVTDVLRDLDYSYFYSCGPAAMFDAMEKIMKTSGQYSLEARMGCGFGACMGCSIETRSGAKRVCRDGPVFVREEIFG